MYLHFAMLYFFRCRYWEEGEAYFIRSIYFYKIVSFCNYNSNQTHTIITHWSWVPYIYLDMSHNWWLKDPNREINFTIIIISTYDFFCKGFNCSQRLQNKTVSIIQCDFSSTITPTLFFYDLCNVSSSYQSLTFKFQ